MSMTKLLFINGTGGEMPDQVTLLGNPFGIGAELQRYSSRTPCFARGRHKAENRFYGKRLLPNAPRRAYPTFS